MKPMRVLVAMSGGVDSSVAAARLSAAGHHVTGVTLRLWGGESDSGCCSVADVQDARRVADRIGIEHLVFGFKEAFEERVVTPYVRDHALGLTPNPCIECNRHLKFDLLWRRAQALGFDAVATGHHARVRRDGRSTQLCRGADLEKDQSYVLWVVPDEVLACTLLPIGEISKSEVRREAAELGLRTAQKPDSQDVCFIRRSEGREAFLARRIHLRSAEVRNENGTVVGVIPSAEMVTVGQRRGLGVDGTGAPRYALSVDPLGRVVAVGPRDHLLVDEVVLGSFRSVGTAELPESDEELVAQCSAHGPPRRATVTITDVDSGQAIVRFRESITRVAPGQSIVLYRGDAVVAGGVVLKTG